MLFTDLLDEYLNTKAEAERVYEVLGRHNTGEGEFTTEELWKTTQEYQRFIAAKNAVNACVQMVGERR